MNPRTPRLPKDAKPFARLLVKKIGGWKELKFDASVERHGVTWYRLKDGWSGRIGEEAWIADIATGCVSLTDYEFKAMKTIFTRKYQSFEEGILAEMKEGIENAIKRRDEHLGKAADNESVRKLLTEALQRAEKGAS